MSMSDQVVTGYRGRLAPSPTGHLHLGHARTFWVAHRRARARGGVLVLRNEDLDPERSQAGFVADFIEDLRWLGLDWDEGPDVGGAHGPYRQSDRRSFYLTAFRALLAGGWLYPCRCSRRDVQQAAGAPQGADDEVVYPGTCRGLANGPAEDWPGQPASEPRERGRVGTGEEPRRAGVRVNWRFRVPTGERVSFVDGYFGPQEFVAGRDFGDFVVWRHDDVPSYQLAVTVDDAWMGMTEVVRGADLLVSTARQLLIYRALGRRAPEFYHCPLMLDEHGVRLAKRHDALSLRQLRAAGWSPAAVRERMGELGSSMRDSSLR